MQKKVIFYLLFFIIQFVCGNVLFAQQNKTGQAGESYSFLSDNHSQSSPFSLKTNLLYDALLVPNVGLEFFFKERWSVALNWMYAWWKTDRRHYYWRVYGGDLETRFWLKQEGYGSRRSGHHVGAYVQTGTFDFELGGRGYMVDDWGYGGGLAYGYALPVARKLNLDFSVGLGIFHGVCKEYLPIDGHYVWQVTKKRNWIGPTKVEVSLVWHLGNRN